MHCWRLYCTRVPQDGRRGSEFLTYGVKHLKTWIVNDSEQWQGTTGSFGTDHIENVLSAIYVPALHYMAAPGDSCVLTGFASGQVGCWLLQHGWTLQGRTCFATVHPVSHDAGGQVCFGSGSVFRWVGAFLWCLLKALHGVASKCAACAVL